MKAVTRSEHKRKEFIICVLQHIRNLKDLGGIAKHMGFTQVGINQSNSKDVDTVKFSRFSLFER